MKLDHINPRGEQTFVHSQGAEVFFDKSNERLVGVLYTHMYRLVFCEIIADWEAKLHHEFTSRLQVVAYLQNKWKV